MCFLHRTICKCCKLFYLSNPKCSKIKRNIICKNLFIFNSEKFEMKEIIMNKMCKFTNIVICSDCSSIFKCDYCEKKCKMGLKKHEIIKINKILFNEPYALKFDYELTDNILFEHYFKKIKKGYFENEKSKIIAEKWQKIIFLKKLKKMKLKN